MTRHGSWLASAAMSNVLITGCSSRLRRARRAHVRRPGHTVVATMRTPGKSAAINARPEIQPARRSTSPAPTSVNAAVAEAIARGRPARRRGQQRRASSRSARSTCSPTTRSQRQFDTNVTGVVRVVRAVVPHMLAQRRRRHRQRRLGGGSGGHPLRRHVRRHQARGRGAHRGDALRARPPRHPCVRGRARASSPRNSTPTAAHAAAMADAPRRSSAISATGSRRSRSSAAGPPIRSWWPTPSYAPPPSGPGVLRHPVGADADLVLGRQERDALRGVRGRDATVLNWHD